MNQDFFISADPGMARRLVKLSRIMAINLDPAISTIAETGLLTETDFVGRAALKPSERDAVQSLIDYDFRAIFPSPAPMRNAICTLVAAKIAKLSHITVLTKRAKLWNDTRKSFGFSEEELVTVEPDAPSRKKMPDADLVRERRGGILIIDDQVALHSSEVTLWPMDFPKTVILTARHLVTDLNDFIAVLSPGAPDEILTNSNPYFKRDLELRGFKTTRPEELAFLFNIVTDTMSITRQADVEQVEQTDIDLELFAKLEHNIALGHLRLG